MKVKKILCLAMTAVIGVGCLTGCGEKQTSDADTTVVTVWGGGAGVNVEANFAKKFNETIGAEKHIRIDFQAKEGDIQQQVEVALQSGKAPDIFPTGKVKEMAEKKYIAPLSKFKGGKEIVEQSMQYGGSSREGVNFANGEAYAITKGVLTWGIIYNVDMFIEAGLVDENGDPTPPKTWQQFREYAKKLTNKEKRQYGVILPMKWGAWFDYDIKIPASSSKATFGFNTDTMQYDYSDYNELFNVLMGIKKDGSCYPGSEGIDNDPARARFAEGNIGMKISVSWDSGVFKEQFVPNFDWSVAPIPTYSEDEQYTQYMMLENSNFINASVLGTAREEAVFEVWKYWTGDEHAIELYKEGISLPLNYDLVKDIKTDIKGWKEFAQMKEISAAPTVGMPTLITGEKSLKEFFINDIWNGKMSVEEATKAATKIANDGIDRYYEQNPSENRAEDEKAVTKRALR